MNRFRALATVLALLVVSAVLARESPPNTISPDAAGAVVVPAPPNATPEQTKEVGDAAARNLKDVASGAVPLEKATRDLRESIDPGSNTTFWVLSLVFGLVFRPIIDACIHRIQGISDDLGGRITLGLCLLFFFAAWAGLHASRPDLPQDWESWLFAGFGANGAGSIFALRKSTS